MADDALTRKDAEMGRLTREEIIEAVPSRADSLWAANIQRPLRPRHPRPVHRIRARDMRIEDDLKAELALKQGANVVLETALRYYASGPDVGASVAVHA